MGQGKATVGQKWHSLHKTTSHRDVGCYEQGAPCPSESHGTHNASAVLGASSPPTDVDETPFDDNFDRGLVCKGLVVVSGERGLSPTPTDS